VPDLDLQPIKSVSEIPVLIHLTTEAAWRSIQVEVSSVSYLRWYLSWQMYMDILKKRPSSERIGDFGQLNLLKKQRIGRRTNKLEILIQSWWWGKKYRSTGYQLQKIWLRIGNWHWSNLL